MGNQPTRSKTDLQVVTAIIESEVNPMEVRNVRTIRRERRARTSFQKG